MASKKRGQNEGSIFQRKDGRWCAVLNLGWRGGKRLRKSFYAATREKVAALLAKAKTAHDSGLPIPHGSDIVADYLNRWLDQVRPTIKPRTFEAYELYIRKHAIPVI